jgi:hypothetical protein
MKQVDLVVGAVTGYKWDQIKHWANSLDRSGFTGKKVVIAYNMDYDTAEELTNRGYHIIGFYRDDLARQITYPVKDFSIVVERFLHYYLTLTNQSNRECTRFIIATDVRDVIFQRNPSEYLDGEWLRGHDLVMSSEGIAYKHEDWGNNNLFQSFGTSLWNTHKDNTIVNCGVIAGKFDAFLGLAKTIYLACLHAPQHVPGGGGPDQAALNLILDTYVYEHITWISSHESTWAAQLGTMMDPRKIDMYKPFLTEPLPTFNRETNQVVNHRGLPFSIVHQWDRVPEVKEAVERLYS